MIKQKTPSEWNVMEVNTIENRKLLQKSKPHRRVCWNKYDTTEEKR